MARAVRWDLIADPRRFQKGFRDAERSTHRLTSTVKRTASVIGGAFAAVQVAGFLKGAIDEAREAQKVGKQTAAVIKATGGVAKVSAKDVDRLATALSNKAAVDDELIASGANLLLTFRGVRNEAGRGNKIFDQASAAILDMTAAMNSGTITQEGLKASTIQVGKALNDPIKGLTALTRVGVTFTQGQKDQIKAMVAAGDTMGAQKIILAELKSEFGGAAAAAADPWKRVGVVMGNVKEAIGTALLPVVDRLATFFADKLIPAAQSWWSKHGPALSRTFGDARDKVAGFFAELRDNLQPQLDRLKKAWEGNRKAILDLLGTLTQGQDEFANGKDAAKSLGDALVGATEAAGKIARGLKTAGNVVNELDRRMQASAKDIHNSFIVPVVRDILRVALVVVQAWHQTARATATVAEALHLPWAKGMRKAEQVIGRSIGAIKRQIASVKSKSVSVTAEAKVSLAKTTIAYLRAFHVKAPQFATGGPVSGPGTGTSDSVPAWLSAGEYVVNARAAARHRQELEWINADRYATGGVVGPKLDRVLRADAQATRIMGQSLIGRVASTLGRAIAKAIDKAASAGGGAPGIKAFILSTDRLPYRWGAAGPGAYDCSGLVGAVYGKMRGDPRAGRGRRYFTTGSISTAVPGLRSGLGGVLNIGVTAGSGHMAGSYGGLGFEARSTRTGIFTGRAARSPGSFARHYHMASGGLVGLAGQLGRVRGLDVAGDPSRMTVVGGRFRGYDRGGWLPTGLSLAYNGTGRPERVGSGLSRADADLLADAFLRALERRPPVVRVDEVHRGLLAHKRGRGNIALGLG